MKYIKTGLKLYLYQMTVMLVSLIITVLMFSMAQDKPWAVSLITSIIFCLTVYVTVWNVGKKDSRKIPGFYPDKSAPVIISATASVIPVVLLLIRLIAPSIWKINLPFLTGEYDFLLLNCKIIGTPDWIYRLWYFPFAAFVPTGNIPAYIAELFPLPVLTFLGYYFGLKRMNLAEYIYANIFFNGGGKNAEKMRK